MSGKSEILWTDVTVNPQGWGCYGPGGTPEKPRRCANCYAFRMSKGPYTPDCEDCRAFVPHWHPAQLDKLPKKKHKAVFWQSMGDLWHPSTPQEYLSEVLDKCIDTPHCTHIFLTKNPKRYIGEGVIVGFPFELQKIKNVYCGVTVRNQAEADSLVPILLKLKAAYGVNIYISFEPALGPVEFRGISVDASTIRNPGSVGAFGDVDAVIMGGENGPRARPMHPDWARQVRDDCAAAGVDFFFKGWGEWLDFEDDAEGRHKFSGEIYVVGPKMGECLGSGWRKDGMVETDYVERGGRWMQCVGRKRAGRLLDGVEHNDLPWPVSGFRVEPVGGK